MIVILGLACLVTIIASAVFNDPATPPVSDVDDVVVIAVDAVVSLSCCEEAVDVVNGVDTMTILAVTSLFELSPVVCGVVVVADVDVKALETEDAADERLEAVDEGAFEDAEDVVDSPPVEIETTEAVMEGAEHELVVTLSPLSRLLKEVEDDDEGGAALESPFFAAGDASDSAAVDASTSSLADPSKSAFTFLNPPTELEVVGLEAILLIVIRE